MGKFVQGLDAALVAAIKTPAEGRTDDQWQALKKAYEPLDDEWKSLRETVAQVRFESQNRRSVGVQDLAWALMNSPAFLFNR
jgi:hypothetical protein